MHCAVVATVIGAVAASSFDRRLGAEDVADGFEFLSIGDWGASAAKEIAGYMAAESPTFVLAIGDNFYSDGVKSVDDPQFKDKYEDTFTGKSLQVPWYVCAGNHDYYGGDTGIQAEMAYTKKSSRWVYPSLYYDKMETALDGTSVHILSIDTWRLNGGDTYVKYDPVSGKSALRNASDVEHKYQSGDMEKAKRDVLLKMFEEESKEIGELRVRADTEQLTWIENTLKASTADWTVVIGHFPVYSCTTGEHGDTKSLKAQLAPLLVKYKVDAYFNGHDHILQHILKDGVHYFGSGAGAQKHTGVDTAYAGLLGHHEGHYGFMVHHVNKTALSTVFVDDTGSRPYSYTITK